MAGEEPRGTLPRHLLEQEEPLKGNTQMIFSLSLTFSHIHTYTVQTPNYFLYLNHFRGSLLIIQLISKAVAIVWKIFLLQNVKIKVSYFNLKCTLSLVQIFKSPFSTMLCKVKEQNSHSISVNWHY